mmetsp:Transcript_82983/g.169125  ORF Transcript_82983/g.169125 Transcript_82983/m.169125 type:complete len:178 (-) Transcript_82983:59-592(-)
MASHDVVVLFFTGHGSRMDDTTCLVDSVGSHVSVRKLQAVFAEAVEERQLRDVSFVLILDCGQTTSSGVADPSDDRDDLNVCVADASECSWFVGYATSPGTKAFSGDAGELTLFTSSILRHVATRASIEAVFRAVHHEVLSATNGLMRPRLEARLNRPLVLVDRGGAPGAGAGVVRG